MFPNTSPVLAIQDEGEFRFSKPGDQILLIFSAHIRDPSAPFPQVAIVIPRCLENSWLNYHRRRAGIRIVVPAPNFPIKIDALAL